MQNRPPDALLDRLFHRLVRALRAEGVGDLARPFTVGELTAALVPYRAYRNELGTETLQDYEHAVLLLLAGEGGRVASDPATVALVQRELRSPDPDTSLVRRIASAEARVASPEGALAVAMQPTPEGSRLVGTPGSQTPVGGGTPVTPIGSAPSATPTWTTPGASVGDASPDVGSSSAPEAPSPAIPAGIVIPSPTGLLAIPAIPGPIQALASRGPASNPGARALVPPPPPVPTIVPAPPRDAVTTPVRPSADDVRSALERLRVVEREGVATPTETTPVPPTTSASMPVAPSTAAPVTRSQGAERTQPVAPRAPEPPRPAVAATEPRPAGEPIDFRGMRHAPVDVGGVMLLFGVVARDLGLAVEGVTRGFPRADVLRRTPGGQVQRLRTDFALESADFRDAGRDDAAVELLVCWRDTWPDRPARLQVLELRRVIQHLGSRAG